MVRLPLKDNRVCGTTALWNLVRILCSSIKLSVSCSYLLTISGVAIPAICSRSCVCIGYLISLDYADAGLTLRLSWLLVTSYWVSYSHYLSDSDVGVSGELFPSGLELLLLCCEVVSIRFIWTMVNGCFFIEDRFIFNY